MTTYVRDSLVGLAKIPSAVPLGPQTLIEPDAPLLVDYVQRELRPRFVELGASDVLDLPGNQFAVRFGSGKGPCLALVAYTPTQHHNLMADPWSGRIRTPVELGIDEPCVFGQGITQNKAHQACLLSLAKWLIEERVELDGTLLLCVNNEGRSSHDCSRLMLDNLPVRPDLMIQLFNTGFEVCVGNRGRIDLHVRIDGTAAHSANPPAGGGVIEVTGRVLRAIELLNERVSLRGDDLLGAEQIVPYQVVFDPLAPHTLPESGAITLDRRLLPGTDPDACVAELRSALGDVPRGSCEITVEPGVTMLPALFPAEHADRLVPLDDAIHYELGRPAEHTVYPGSFDAGGPSARGIPTVMFGVPDEGDLLGDDFLRLSYLAHQERILRSTVAAYLGATGAE